MACGLQRGAVSWRLSLRVWTALPESSRLLVLRRPQGPPCIPQGGRGFPHPNFPGRGGHRFPARGVGETRRLGCGQSCAFTWENPAPPVRAAPWSEGTAVRCCSRPSCPAGVGTRPRGGSDSRLLALASWRSRFKLGLAGCIGAHHATGVWGYSGVTGPSGPSR